MKKKMALVLTSALLISLLGGCGNSQSENTDDSSNTNTDSQSSFEGETLNLLMPQSGSDREAIYAQIDAFEEKYGVTVNLEEVPDGDEGENIMKVRIATDAMPDIMVSSVGAKLEQLDPVKNFVDLSGEDFIDNLDDGFKEVVTYDGGVYAVPSTTANIAGVYYNKPVFEDLGLEIPETWNELMDICEQIKDAGIAPVVAPYEQSSQAQIPFLMNYYYVLQENPDFAEQYTANEIKLSDNKAFVRGLDKMYQLAVNGYLNDDYLATSYDRASSMLASGEGAMFITRSNCLANIESANPDALENIGFFPLPDEDPDVRGVASWMPVSYCITKSAKNMDLCKEFLRFIISEESIDVYCETMNPYGLFLVKGVELPDSVCSALKEAKEYYDVASTPVMEYFCPIKGANQASICVQVASGTLTAEEGCAEIESDNELMAQQLGLENW